jgi:hypothetical protein
MLCLIAGMNDAAERTGLAVGVAAEHAAAPAAAVLPLCRSTVATPARTSLVDCACNLKGSEHDDA